MWRSDDFKADSRDDRAERKAKLKRRLLKSISTIQGKIDHCTSKLMSLYQSLELDQPFSLELCIFRHNQVAKRKGTKENLLQQQVEVLQQNVLKMEDVLNLNDRELTELDNQMNALDSAIQLQ
jgi:hypothetical protein